MIAPSGEQIEIALGDQRAVVVEAGGGLRAYSVAGRDVLDGYGRDEMCSSGRGQVLIPWPNRLQDGSYEFDGRHHQLPLTEPDRQNAIHGLVRWGAWTVGERERHRVLIEHTCIRSAGTPSRSRSASSTCSPTKDFEYGRRRRTSGRIPVRMEAVRIPI